MEITNIKLSLDRLFNVASIMLTMFAFACDDDNESTIEEITEEDVAEIIAASLSDEDGGLASDITNMLDEAEEECGFTKTESLVDSDDGENRSYVVEYNYSLKVICDEDDNLIRIDYTYSSSRQAELVRLDVSNNIDSEWQFFDDGQFYILDGQYDYTGEESFKVRNSNSFSSSIEYLTNNLQASVDGDLLSGEISFSQQVSIPEEQSTYSGSIVITATNIALLDVSGFEYLYEIDLEDGSVETVQR